MKLSEKLFWNNRIVTTLILLGIASLLSCLKLCVLSKGGCLTMMSLGVLWLITYFYGVKWGVFWYVFVFSWMKLLITYMTGEPVNWNIGAILLEYPIAFLVFSFGGFLSSNRQARLAIERNHKREQEFSPIDKTIRSPEPIATEQYENSLFGLIGGYLIGIFGILICYVISSLLFYPPDRPTFWANLWHEIKYDSSYLLIEAALTVIIYLIPGVHKALFEIKHITNNKKEDPSESSF